MILEQLMEKLRLYMQENNPDVLLQLEEQGEVTKYLNNKMSTVEELLNNPESQPEYIIEELCMEILTVELRPSKFNFICNILEEEFEPCFIKLRNSGLIWFEAVNLITHCKPVFEEFGFTIENEDDRYLRYNIIGAISEYLERDK